MRKLTLAAALLVALVAASVAVAHGIEGARSAKVVAGTFTATQANVSSASCTTADNTSVTVTDGRYTGTASGDPDLSGPITLRARSVIDTTHGLGTVSGELKIAVASGRNAVARYSAVYDHGSLAGLATGNAGSPSARLVGNLSATFDPKAGFTNGKLGGGTAGGSAVELLPGPCTKSATTVQRSEARGTVSAVSATSITVAGLTCAVPTSLSAALNSKLHVGDRAQIRCSLQSGQSTLVSFHAGK